MKRLKDNSDATEARHGTLPKIFSSSKKKTKLHSTRPRRNGYSRLRQQKSLRKESLWWIPELACIWSTRNTLTQPNWRPGGHWGVRRWWWRPTARCKQEKKPRCQRIGLIRDGYASWRNSSSSVSREALRGSWVYSPLDQRSKNHISPKMARELIAINQTMCHSWSLVYRQAPPQNPHLLLQHLHHWILYLTAGDTPKIQDQREVEVRVKSYGESHCINLQKPKTKKKWRTRRSTKRSIAWLARLASGVQRKIGRWM